jgi:hypothetical protein
MVAVGVNKKREKDYAEGSRRCSCDAVTARYYDLTLVSRMHGSTSTARDVS